MYDKVSQISENRQNDAAPCENGQQWYYLDGPWFFQRDSLIVDSKWVIAQYIPIP